MAILLPFIVAILLLLFFRNFSRFHIGWFVIFVPAVLFILLSRKIPFIANGGTITQIIHWIPTYDINFVTHLDGLSMIFGLLITGIGTLVEIGRASCRERVYGSVMSVLLYVKELYT